jgi:hypothetical protein
VLGSEAGSDGEEEILVRPRARLSAFDSQSEDVSQEQVLAKFQEVAFVHNHGPAEGAKHSKAIGPPDPLADFKKQKAENAKPDAAKVEAVTLNAASAPAIVLPISSGVSHVSLESNPTAANANQPASPPKKPELKPKPIAARPGPPLPAKIIDFKTFLPAKFPFDKESIMAENLGTPLTGKDGIHVFVDLSNILHGLQKYLEHRTYITEAALAASPNKRRVPHLSLDFDALSLLMERGRPAARRFILGSWPVHTSVTFNRMVEKCKRRGYQTVIYQKVPVDPNHSKSPAHWKEQGVDEGLQAKMAESLFFGTYAPGTMIVATGDGARSTLGDGFSAYIDQALKNGWKVEIMAWGSSTSKRYLDVNWQYQWREQVRFVNLEDFSAHLFEHPQSANNSRPPSVNSAPMKK